MQNTKTLSKVVAWDNVNRFILRMTVSIDEHNLVEASYYIYKMVGYSLKDMHELVIEEFEEIGTFGEEFNYDPIKGEYSWTKNMTFEQIEDFLFGSSSWDNGCMKGYFASPYYPILENAGQNLESSEYMEGLSPELEVMISLCKRHSGKEVSNQLAGFIIYWFEALEEVEPEAVRKDINAEKTVTGQGGTEDGKQNGSF